MNTVLKPGMNLDAFNKELATLVEKHGGVLTGTPMLSAFMPKKIEERFGPFQVTEERTPVRIEFQVTAESLVVHKDFWRAA